MTWSTTRTLAVWTLAATAGLALLACGRADGDPDYRHGNPIALAGEWKLVLHENGASDAIGTVRFAPVVTWDRGDTQRDSIPHLDGRFTLTTLGNLRGPPRDSVATAYAATDNSVSIPIFLAGAGCHDCGNVWLTGTLRSGEIQGRWSQEFLGTGHEGRFELRRP
ncbi:MAG TPA: hypothetical protein VGI83_09690 [Gemmatimonadales bacterium]|jgi:hypothetical protein